MDTIRLSCDGCTAEIMRYGAQIASFKGADGHEVIWQADPDVWDEHSPVLFPVCCSVINRQIKINGTPYPMPMHGFAHTSMFEVARSGDDFVELVLTANDETRTMYPFDFALHVIYTLVENGFTATFLVENLSDQIMPFCIGGHPGFICPMEEGSVFSDYQLVFPHVEDGLNALVPGGALVDGFGYIPGFHNSDTLPLSHELFDIRDTLIFANLKSRSVNLVHRTSGKGIHFSFPKMEVLGVWSNPGTHSDYVCLEPWHGMPGQVGDSGHFEDKPYVTMLQPGQSYLTWFTATLIGQV